MDKRYHAIDLFAGIGGIRLGFEQAFKDQIQFIFASDIAPKAKAVYKLNFGDEPHGDITKIESKDIPNFDILVGGFPCQAFSILGRKGGFDDTRGTLFFEIARILETKKPLMFLLENVKNLVSHEKGRTFVRIIEILDMLGYNPHYKILDAQHFGVPQHRERVYIVGFSKNYEFEFPEPRPVSKRVKDILEPHVDTSFYLTQRGLNGVKFRNKKNRGLKLGYRFYPLDPNGVSNTLCYGGSGVEMTMVKDKIVPNAWHEGGDITLPNNEGWRHTTPREWARFQGFPDTFQFSFPKSVMYKLFANSVAVPVIRAIAEKMLESVTNGVLKPRKKQVSLSQY